jgi:hypothetical protein
MAVGRKARCKKCGESFVVIPAAERKAAPARNPYLPETGQLIVAIIRSLKGGLGPVSPSKQRRPLDHKEERNAAKPGPRRKADRRAKDAGNKNETIIETLDIDRSLQGLWIIDGISEDKGKTFTGERGVPLARVFAKKIEMTNGRTLVVERAVAHRGDGRSIVTTIQFTNGVIWRVKNEAEVIVKVLKLLKGNLMKERRRFVVRIEQGL